MAGKGSFRAGASVPLLDSPINSKYDQSEISEGIPQRAQQYLISWIFVFASATLLVEFIIIAVNVPEDCTICPQGKYQAIYHNGSALCDDCTYDGHIALPKQCGKNIYTASTDEQCPLSSIQNLQNWFGSISCILWLQGFIILLHWIITAIGAPFYSVLGCCLKLVASVFFNIAPGTGLWLQLANGPKQTDWSNFVGILFFHTGNMIDSWNLSYTVDTKNPWALGNWTAYGMYVLLSATTFLVTGNALLYFQVIEAESSDPAINIIDAFAIVGASLLLLGSLIYLRISS